MAKGGYRPGSGRPKGSKGLPKKALEAEALAHQIHGYQSPLEYMLTVMNDREADAVRRDRMAIAAAPFVYARPGDTGKKEDLAAQSKVADAGTEWEGLLQ